MKTRTRSNPLNALGGTPSTSKPLPQNNSVTKRVPVTARTTSPRRVSNIKNEDSGDEDYELDDSDNDSQESEGASANLAPATIKEEEENSKFDFKRPLKQLSITSFTQAVSRHAITRESIGAISNRLLPDPEDPNLHCRVCKKSFNMLGKYRSHLKRMHKMSLKPLVGLNKDNLHITPEENDPNNYCKSCERTFPSRSLYRTHLKNVHKMKIKPALKAMHLVEDAEELPEIDDPNFYCRVCDTTFDSRKYYRHHITFVHRILLVPVRRKDHDPNLLPDANDPENYCQVCDIFVSSRNNFNRHLKLIHKMTIQQPKKRVKKKPPTDELPDVDDPNFYCCVCDRNSTNQFNYRIHLRRKHKMTLTPLKQDPDGIQHIIPDENDPDFYCRVCDGFFNSIHNYRRHLQSVHKIKAVGKSQCVPNPEIQPDSKDPNNYCRSCDKSFNKAGNYNRHLRDIHKAIPHIRQSTKDPNIIPDVDDPNNYCKSCKKTYEGRARYNQHLKAIHQMIFPTNKAAPIFDPNYKGDINDTSNKYCFICKIIYSTRQSYKNHMRYSHKDNNNTPIKSSPAAARTDIQPDLNDPDFNCASCSIKYQSKAAYQDHLRKIHKIEIVRVRGKMDPNIAPDIHHPDYYCASCNFTFKKRAFFVHHLRTLHKMFVPTPTPLPKRKISEKEVKDREGKRYKKQEIAPSGFNCDICKTDHVSKQYLVLHLKKIHNIITTGLLVNCRPKLGIQPDVDDKDNVYCKSCRYAFGSASIYQRHLVDLHGIQLPTPPPLDALVMFGQYEIDDPSNNCCRICDHSFSDHRQFLMHLRDYHDIAVTVKTRKKQVYDVLPDLDDPNSHCKPCNITYGNRLKYSMHLRGTHGVILKNPHDITVPDYNDPNFYCRSCTIRYPTQNTFRNHLIMYHNYRGEVVEEEEEDEEEEMGVEEKTATTDEKQNVLLPDPNDPNFHCSLCNFTYTARITFQKHLVGVHKIHVARIGKATPHNIEMEPGDITNATSSYCRSCKVSFSSLVRYRRHVRFVHNVITPRTIHSVNVDNRCVPCNITFVSKDYLGKHADQFHGSSSSGGGSNQEGGVNDTALNSDAIPAIIKMEGQDYN